MKSDGDLIILSRLSSLILSSLSASQEARKGRQTQDEDLEGFQSEETCETTGFEFREREECQVTEDNGGQRTENIFRKCLRQSAETLRLPS